MHKIWPVVTGGALILLAAGVAQFLFPRTAVSPSPVASEPLPVTEQNISATTTDARATTTAVNTQKSPVTNPLPLAKGDTIVSWNFTGAYANNPELITKAEAEITRLSELVGKDEYPDMTLYVSIANQYELLGKGREQYDYLNNAIKAGGTTSGLPWHNLGVLMEKLGAYETARVAYEKTTLLQPSLKQWHYAYLEFLTTRMKNNAADIEKEYAAATKYLGQDADILQLYSEWKQA